MNLQTQLPIYHSWDNIPEGLHTKTQLLKERLVLPADIEPAAYKKSTTPTRYYALYRRDDAIPLPPKREVQPRDYTVQFAKRYASKRAAYLEASQACFSLNRYAKHESCTQKHRETIYNLKNAWIKLLYSEGFCTEAIQIVTPKKDLICFDCTNTPDKWIEDCYRCNSTGVYRTVGGKEYWAFRFTVDEHTFSWHQPAPLTFVAVPTQDKAEREVIVEEKPVALSPRKFAEAKALIRWCLETQESEQS